VDPVPDPLLLRKSGSAGNKTRDPGSVARNFDHLTTEAVKKWTINQKEQRNHLQLAFASTVGTRDPIFLFVPRPLMCSEMGHPLRREEGSVFLSRRQICCAVTTHE
jgi:hypothetical protein